MIQKVFRAIHEEEARQEHNIELIASENIVSPAVRAATRVGVDE